MHKIPGKSQLSTQFGNLTSTLLEFFETISAKHQKSLRVLGLLLTGFIFGLSVSIGLGANRESSVFAGLLAALGVLLAGSFIGYLVIQILSLSFLAFIAYTMFRIAPSIALEAPTIQILYGVVVVLTPLLALHPRVKKGISIFASQHVLQLLAVIVFAGLLRFLRFGRPSEPKYALSQMYGAEDNAGVVAVLAKSLEHGYSSHASLFGEFFNGLYLASSGYIAYFGDSSNESLISVLTHWNVTTIFLAWAPIAAIMAFVFSGMKLRFIHALSFFTVVTALLILLFWPFVNFGHTSVISSGLLAMSLLALTLNQEWAEKYPFLLLSVSIAFGFIISTTWFPLMPLSAALALIIGIGLLKMQKGPNSKSVVPKIVSLFVVSGLVLLPEVLARISESGHYLELAGGTRDVNGTLILLWLTVTTLSLWGVSKAKNHFFGFGKSLFSIGLLLLVSSNLILLLRGIAGNAGDPGYGASKYLITSIAITLPLTWAVYIFQKKNKNFYRILMSGIVILYSLITFQHDSRPVASSFFQPVVIADTGSAQSGVFLAIEQALQRNPEQIFCVSDYGIPVPEAELNMNSYQCTRWAQSIVGDEGGQEWRFVPLGRISEESLQPVLDAYRAKEVVIIRFIDSGNPLLVDHTWWSKYIDDSWEIITVK
jgi:hypothetical protein